MGFKSKGENGGGGSFKVYAGVGTFTAVTANPTAAEEAEIKGTTPKENENVYFSKGNDGIGAIKINIWMRSSDYGFTIPVRFSVKNQMMVTEKNGVKKLKVIDKFGSTAWVTQEEFKAKTIPLINDEPAKISTDYRPCYKGEEEIVSFIRMLLNLKKGKEGCLDSVPEIGKDNGASLVNEVREALALAGDNRIKLVVGTRVYNNSLYMNANSRYFLPAWKNDVSYVQGKILKEQEKGFDNDTTYVFTDLAEITAKPTDHSQKAEEKQAEGDLFSMPAGGENTAEADPFSQPATEEAEDPELPF